MRLFNKITGKVYKFGDDIDTDQIFPGRYLYLTLPSEIATHVMEGADPNFYEKIKEKGGIIVAGKNFGCGSSREHAARVLLSAGIKAVIAFSFARIFFRNAINVGLPILESSELFKIINPEEKVEIDIEQGKIIKLESKETLSIESKMPEQIFQIIRSGGLIAFLKKYGREAYHQDYSRN